MHAIITLGWVMPSLISCFESEGFIGFRPVCVEALATKECIQAQQDSVGFSGEVCQWHTAPKKGLSTPTLQTYQTVIMTFKQPAATCRTQSEKN